MELPILVQSLVWWENHSIFGRLIERYDSYRSDQPDDSGHSCHKDIDDINGGWRTEGHRK